MLNESITAIAAGMAYWRDSKDDDGKAQQRKQSALASVMDAVILTKGYLYDIESGAKPQRKRDGEIASCWQKAAMAIRRYDQQLYKSAQLKAMGWADPREWKHADSRPWAIKLDKIIAQCDWLQRNS